MSKDKEQKRQEKLLKRFLRKRFNKGIPKTLDSLMDSSRCRNDEDGDGYKEYGFIPASTKYWTDEQVVEFLEDYVKIPYRATYYDCTGQAFTLWIDWHRNPSGLVSFIHRVGLDV